MSTVIKLKRGTSTPTTSDLVNGEVALDTSAKKLYVNDAGTIKEIGADAALTASQLNDINVVAGQVAHGTDLGSITDTLSSASGASNIQTVANNITNINAVAGDATDIGAVAGKATEIGRLGTADAVADLNTLGTSDVVSDMNTLATTSNVSNMNTVAGSISNVNTVAAQISNNNLQTVAADIAKVVTAANDLNETVSEIDTVATNITNVNNVGNNISNVNTVAGISSNVTAVKNNATNINAVAGNATNINAVANNATNINAVKNNSSNINAAVSNATNINSVVSNATNINTVATNVADINNFTDRYQISSSAPTQRSDGSSLQDGDLWFNTSNDGMEAYDGSSGDGFTPIQPSQATLQAINQVTGFVTFTEDNGLITDAINTGSGNNSINTVADDISNVNTVAGSIANVNTTAGSISNVNTVAGNITNVNNVGGSISAVNRYADEYVIQSSTPSSPSAGDLWYNTTANVLNYYSGSTWVGISPGIAGLINDSSPALANHLDCNNKNLTEVGTVSGNNLQIDFGTL